MNFFDKISDWWSTVNNKEALLDRLLNKETIYAFIVGGSTLGVWQIAPNIVHVITAGLVGLWTLYKFVQRSK